MSAGPRVLIAGAGQAGVEAATVLRSAGFTGPVRVVGDEPAAPYQRPPLSKAHLSGTGALPLRGADFYRSKGIELTLGDRVVGIDRARQRVRLATGARPAYDRLVLALGAGPRRLPVPGADLAGVRELRTVADADALRADLTGPGRQLVVIGGGFLGLEVAAAARELGHDVTVLEAADRPLSRGVSATAAGHLAGVHADRGVRILTGAGVRALRGDRAGRVGSVELADGRLLPADVVLTAVGAVPRTGPAADAGLVVDDGIVVDADLRTCDPHVLAVGDCARVDGAGRLESVQNAVDQARHAATAILADFGAGPAPGRYRAVPTFWTTQHGQNLQIAGLPTGREDAVVVGDRAGGRFSVLLFDGGGLRAVESVNRPVDHMAARALLAAESGPSPVAAALPGYALMDDARARGLLGGPAQRRAG